MDTDTDTDTANNCIRIPIFTPNSNGIEDCSNSPRVTIKHFRGRMCVLKFKVHIKVFKRRLGFYLTSFLILEYGL